MSKATESMFDGKNVLIPLEEVSYVLKFQNCIEVRLKDSADSLTLAQPDKNAFISAWCRYRGEVEADTLMDLDGAQPAPSALAEAIIADMQAQHDSELITENDSGEALIRLDGAIAAVEDNFAQPAPIERQEPVAWCSTDETGTVIEALGMNQSRRFDTPLYLVPGAQPAPSFADAYQGAMEDVAIWKKRALEAEDLNRKFVAEINGPAYMGEPAQPAPSIPEGVKKVTRGFHWNGAAQHHTPTIEVEFEPVPAGSPNNAKGWQDRDRLAAMLAAAPEAKP